MKEHVLIYLGANNEKKKEVITLLEKLKVFYTLIDDQYLNNKIDSLFNTENKKTTSYKYPFNFILSKNREREIVASIYLEGEKRGFKFTHKAILTPHNNEWTLELLLSEIQKEHDFFECWNLLDTKLKEANDLDETPYTKESYTLYQTAFINAYLYRKQEKPTKENLEKLIKEIEETKKKLVKK